MEKPYVFCGCQNYPSASAGPSAKKSCWEWDIPTPRPKSKKISQSNPILPTPKRFDMEKINKRLSDNIYEPVNPQPMYGSGYNVNQDRDTASLDERMIDIPADIEIITSDGLDGLDQPDPHDYKAIDGDREWKSFHPDPDDFQVVPHNAPATFTAGIRGQAQQARGSLGGETTSSRPLQGKSITFSSELPDDAASAAATAGSEEPQEVPEEKEPPPSKFEQLKAKAGQVKQRFSKISLPVRPKFNQWTGIKLAKGRGKKGKGAPAGEEEEEEPMEEEAGQAGGWTEPLSLKPELGRPKPGSSKPPPRMPTPDETIPAPQPMDTSPVPAPPPGKAPAPPTSTSKPAKEPQKAPEDPKMKAQPPPEDPKMKAQKAPEDPKKKAEQAPEDPKTKELEAEAEKRKKANEEELKRLQTEEKTQRQKEQEDLKRLKEEEKLQKQKAVEEEKRRRAEEKQKKEEEQKRLKQEYLLQKQKEKEELKKQKELDKERRGKLELELRRAKEEEIQKAKELEEEMSVDLPEEHQETASKGGKTPDKKRKLLDMDFPLFKRGKASPKPDQSPEAPAQESSHKLITPHKFFRPPDRVETVQVILPPPAVEEPPPKEPSPPRQPEPVQQRAKPPRDPPPRQEEGVQQRAKPPRDPPPPRQEEAVPQKHLREPQIFVTQPSVETTTESEAASDPAGRIVYPFEERQDNQRVEYDEGDEEYFEGQEEPKTTPAPSKASQAREQISKKLKGFGVRSKAIAAQTGKNLGKTMKVVGTGIKEFGVNAVQEVKAKQEAVRVRDARRRAEKEQQALEEEEDLEPYSPSPSSPRPKFRFRKSDKRRPEEGQMMVEVLGDGQEGPREIGIQQSPSGRERRKRSPAPPHRGDPRRQEEFVHRSQVLGRADRDWESPLDLAQSRDASEEPRSGQASSRGSPPGSSLASSSIVKGGRHGVLEEIDSDEFFLRERGISEGEDEEEVNRFLVEELRQAFRPTNNALAGFDLPSQPPRPERSPKKPPRKAMDPHNFQTFPPERPKRKRTPGYVSSYMNGNPGEDVRDEEDFREDEENFREDPENFREDPEDLKEDVTLLQGEEEHDDEVLRRVKEELKRIDRDLEDDGRYEPVNDEPTKPARRRKPRKPPSDTPHTDLYYNTIAANEWMRDIENQIQQELDQTDPGSQPVPPKRVKSRSGNNLTLMEDPEIHYADDDLDILPGHGRGGGPPLAPGESTGALGGDDGLDYVDEAGYAVIHRAEAEPRTVPRRKKGRGGAGSKGNSLKRRSQEGRHLVHPAQPPPSSNLTNNPMFFSLPRYTPRTFHIVPPTRPHRTYSTLRPKRPPRSKSKSNLGSTTKLVESQGTVSPSPPARPVTPGSMASPSLRRAGGEDTDPGSGSRPSTAIGIMQGRPLPPPPRPDRTPNHLNDLDQASLERMVNMRYYANFEDGGAEDDLLTRGLQEVVEEPCVARNIPLLTQDEEEEPGGMGNGLANSDINVAVQTDPVPEEEYDLNIAPSSFEDEEERIETKSSVSHLPSEGQEEERDLVPPPIPQRPRPPASSYLGQHQQQQGASPAPAAPQSPPALVFPTRLHLDELAVDHLRVNDLTAATLHLTQRLQAPHLELTSLSSSGPLSVQGITSSSLRVTNLDCDRLASESVDLPSVPPQSFYQLTSPLTPTMPPSSECPDVEDEICPEDCCGTSSQALASSSSEASPAPAAPEGPPPVRTIVTRSSTVVSRTSSTHQDPELEDIVHLSMRLGRALLRITVRSLHAMAEYVEVAGSSDPNCQEQQRANMQVLLCLLLVLVAGVILLFRSGSVESRWQYFLPPADM